MFGSKPSLKYSFSGHETFTFRYGWLKKGMDDALKDPTVFSREDAIVRLGVGKNMVGSIRHWCLATQVLQEDTPVPDKGRVLLKKVRVPASQSSAEGV